MNKKGKLKLKLKFENIRKFQSPPFLKQEASILDKQVSKIEAFLNQGDTFEARGYRFLNKMSGKTREQTAITTTKDKAAKTAQDKRHQDKTITRHQDKPITKEHNHKFKPIKK